MALPTTVVATVTLVVVAGPIVAATLAPSMLLVSGSTIPGPIPLFLFGPTDYPLAYPPFLLTHLLNGLLGPALIGPSLLPLFPLHLGLLLHQAMDFLLVFLVRDLHKAITPGLMLL